MGNMSFLVIVDRGSVKGAETSIQCFLFSVIKVCKVVHVCEKVLLILWNVFCIYTEVATRNIAIMALQILAANNTAYSECNRLLQITFVKEITLCLLSSSAALQRDCISVLGSLQLDWSPLLILWALSGTLMQLAYKSSYKSLSHNLTSENTSKPPIICIFASSSSRYRYISITILQKLTETMWLQAAIWQAIRAKNLQTV